MNARSQVYPKKTRFKLIRLLSVSNQGLRHKGRARVTVNNARVCWPDYGEAASNAIVGTSWIEVKLCDTPCVVACCIP